MQRTALRRVAAVAAVTTTVRPDGRRDRGPGRGRPERQAGQARRRPAARPQRLPRQPRAADRLQRPHPDRARPPGATSTVDAGGAEYLATQLAQLAAAQQKKQHHHRRRRRPDRRVPAALRRVPRRADHRGARAWPGLDYASVGNHEFDEGAAELLRIQNGGCHPVDGCADGTAVPRAPTSSTCPPTPSSPRPASRCWPPYAIHKVQGVKVGFIGMTLEGTPQHRQPAGRRRPRASPTRPRPPTATPRELQAQGVEAIVVLLHEGGAQTGPTAWTSTAASA